MDNFPCPKCGKAFKSKVALATHQQVHKYEEANPQPPDQVGLPGGDGDTPQPPPPLPEEATPAKKDIPPPTGFFIKMTVRLDWDVLYFYFRAKAGGYSGDMSDYINTFCREAYQVRGLKLAEVFDLAMAEELYHKFIKPEVDIGAAG